jgi:hypothetical protein
MPQPNAKGDPPPLRNASPGAHGFDDLNHEVLEVLDTHQITPEAALLHRFGG